MTLRNGKTVARELAEDLYAKLQAFSPEERAEAAKVAHHPEYASTGPLGNAMYAAGIIGLVPAVPSKVRWVLESAFPEEFGELITPWPEA